MMDELKMILNVPAEASERLVRVKLTQVFLSSQRRRVGTSALEAELAEVQSDLAKEKYLAENYNDVEVRNQILANRRKAKAYKREAARIELRQLRQQLNEFRGLEPSNDALRKKIDELKERRLSLEVTFMEPQSL